jgi:hypothetical protein
MGCGRTTNELLVQEAMVAPLTDILHNKSVGDVEVVRLVCLVELGSCRDCVLSRDHYRCSFVVSASHQTRMKFNSFTH